MSFGRTGGWRRLPGRGLQVAATLRGSGAGCCRAVLRVLACLLLTSTVTAVALGARTAHAANGTGDTAPAAGVSTAANSPPGARAADTLEQRLIACTVCHGTQDVVSRDGYYPRLYGKPAGYLYNQLLNFHEGRRSFPLMTYLVGNLSPSYLKEIAQYFSSQHPAYPRPPPVSVDPAQLARGRTIVFEGDPARDVPACASCHGRELTGVAPAIPGLLGLPRDYINAQFGSWRNKTRRTVDPDCMATIATRLADEDVVAASAWLAAQPVAGQAVPAASLPAAMPLACGSVSALMP